MSAKHVISYDIGTTGVKTCLFEINDTITLKSAAMEGYNLYILPDGGAEQDPDEWWSAICSTTATIFENCKDITPDMVDGISFCSQMQGLVLVDKAYPLAHNHRRSLRQRQGTRLEISLAQGQ